MKKFKKKTNKPSYEYLTNTISSSIYLEPPTSNEILNLILSLNDNKALGHDNIPAYFLNVSGYIITPNLKYFTNFIFNNGVFPSNCKIAKVVPIFENARKEETYNYRPISIPTCFSKIIEKIIYNRPGVGNVFFPVRQVVKFNVKIYVCVPMSSLRFHLRFLYFSPKIRMFSKKKKKKSSL